MIPQLICQFKGSIQTNINPSRWPIIIINTKQNFRRQRKSWNSGRQNKTSKTEFKQPKLKIQNNYFHRCGMNSSINIHLLRLNKYRLKRQYVPNGKVRIKLNDLDCTKPMLYTLGNDTKTWLNRKIYEVEHDSTQQKTESTVRTEKKNTKSKQNTRS